MIRKNSFVRCAAGLALAAALVFAQGSPAAPGKRGPNRIDRIATLLNLTDDQKSQVKTILQGSFDQAKPVMQQLRDNRSAIEQLIKTGSAANFDAQVQPLATTQGSLVSQFTVIHAKAFAQIYSLLTPDQRQKADQLREMFGPGPMMGGPGMGMHRGPQGH